MVVHAVQYEALLCGRRCQLLGQPVLKLALEVGHVPGQLVLVQFGGMSDKNTPPFFVSRLALFVKQPRNQPTN